MKKTSIFLLITLITITFIATLSGCSNLAVDEEKNVSISIVEKQSEYLNENDYNIIKSNGITETYILQKSILTEQPHNIIWGLQNLNPEDYFEKTIDAYSYVVSNHKLDSYGDKEETQLWLLICEKEIIGGYSFPNNTEKLYGGVYSLEGLTLEEVTGMNFQTWSEKWMGKYNANSSDSKLQILGVNSENIERMEIIHGNKILYPDLQQNDNLTLIEDFNTALENTGDRITTMNEDLGITLADAQVYAQNDAENYYVYITFVNQQTLNFKKNSNEVLQNCDGLLFDINNMELNWSRDGEFIGIMGYDFNTTSVERDFLTFFKDIENIFADLNN